MKIHDIVVGAYAVCCFVPTGHAAVVSGKHHQFVHFSMKAKVEQTIHYKIIHQQIQTMLAVIESFNIFLFIFLTVVFVFIFLTGERRTCQCQRGCRKRRSTTKETTWV